MFKNVFISPVAAATSFNQLTFAQTLPFPLAAIWLLNCEETETGHVWSEIDYYNVYIDVSSYPNDRTERLSDGYIVQ